MSTQNIPPLPGKITGLKLKKHEVKPGPQPELPATQGEGANAGKPPQVTWSVSFNADPLALGGYQMFAFFPDAGFQRGQHIAKWICRSSQTEIVVPDTLRTKVENGKVVALVVRGVSDRSQPGDYSDPLWVEVKHGENGIELVEVPADKAPKVKPPERRKPAGNPPGPLPPPPNRDDKDKDKGGDKAGADKGKDTDKGRKTGEGEPAEPTPAKPSKTTRENSGGNTLIVHQYFGGRPESSDKGGKDGKGGDGKPSGKDDVIIDETEEDKKKPGSFIKDNWILLLLALIGLGLILLWAIKQGHLHGLLGTSHGAPTTLGTDDSAGSASAGTGGQVGTVSVGNITITGGTNIPSGMHIEQHYGTEINVYAPTLGNGYGMTGPTVGRDGKVTPGEIRALATAAGIAEQFAPPAQNVWPRDFAPTRSFKIPCDLGAFGEIESGSVRLAKAIADAGTLPANGYWEFTVEKPWSIEIQNSLDDVEIAVDGVVVTAQNRNALRNGHVFGIHPRRPNESVALKVVVSK